MSVDPLSAADRAELWAAPPCYLNTALRGIPPRKSVAAAIATIAAWGEGKLDWRGWLDEVDAIRSGFARLVDASPDEIGIGHTSASMMAAVARALPSGGRVITVVNEHNSCTIPFLHAGNDLVIEQVEPAALLDRLARGGFDAVAISLVQSIDGRIADLAAISPLARAAGAWLCVDATQALGWLPFDLHLADFCVASSYKWLMGPNGPAFAWAAAPVRSQLRPAAPNWFACEDPHAAPFGIDFSLAAATRKLDVVPGLVSLAALRPSLDLLGELGLERIHAHDVALARSVRAALGLPENGSAIVTLRHPQAAERLTRAGINATVRDGRARLAFHIHNHAGEADRVIEALSELELEP